MRQCVDCREEKPEDQFRKAGRGLKKSCLACEGGGKAVTTKNAKPVAEPEDAGLRDGPAIRMEPGYGFDAWIENGLLQIMQGESALALTKTEAKVLFAGFAEWAS